MNQSIDQPPANNISELFIYRERPVIGEGDGWRTRRTPLKDQELSRAFQTTGRLVGLRWGEWCSHAVLDLDSTSPYHTARGLRFLCGYLQQVGLRPVVYRSSRSGGWHLYLYFNQPVRSSEIAAGLKLLLESHNYTLVPGVLELFPSANALRLPLQQGWAALDQQGRVLAEREEMTSEQAQQHLQADRLAGWVDPHLVLQSIKQSVRVEQEGVGGAYRQGKRQSRWLAGRRYWRHGLSVPGERHQAIMAVSHYLFYGDLSVGLVPMGYGKEEGRADLIIRWLRSHHNNKSRSIERLGWERVEQDIRSCCAWRPSTRRQVVEGQLSDQTLDRLEKLRVYTVELLKRASQNRMDEARAKIILAVEQLRADGKKITGRAISRLSGCAHQTVSRHQDLWAVKRELCYRSGDVGVLSSGDMGCEDVLPLVVIKPPPLVVVREISGTGLDLIYPSGVLRCRGSPGRIAG